MNKLQYTLDYFYDLPVTEIYKKGLIWSTIEEVTDIVVDNWYEPEQIKVEVRVHTIHKYDIESKVPRSMYVRSIWFEGEPIMLVLKELGGYQQDVDIYITNAVKYREMYGYLSFFARIDKPIVDRYQLIKIQ